MIAMNHTTKMIATIIVKFLKKMTRMIVASMVKMLKKTTKTLKTPKITKLTEIMKEIHGTNICREYQHATKWETGITCIASNMRLRVSSLCCILELGNPQLVFLCYNTV